MTVTEGVELAKKHLMEVLPELSGEAFRLEELETPPAGPRWRFTFSSMLPMPSGNPSLAEIIRGRRITKSVEIDPESGDLLAVKNAAA